MSLCTGNINVRLVDGKCTIDEGDCVVDATMGSGSTGVAAFLENREFIGIEKDENYFAIADKRLDDLQTPEEEV